jgi:ABC-type transport system involved in cytochrome c biogenesis permease subunit
MSESTTPPAAGPAVRERTRGQSGTWHALRKALAPVASLRLTVVLFVLSLLLVFCGTLAQKDVGNDTAVHTYFRSFGVWVPLQIFFPQKLRVGGGFPFPGGYILGGALLLNLLAAHLVRFRLTWRRAGVLVLHTGLVLLLVNELLTDRFAVEGRMSIEEGGSSNYLEDYKKVELAIIDPSAAQTDDVVVIPDALLRRGGKIQNGSLPFEVEVRQFMPNSSIQEEIPPGTDNPADHGDGVRYLGVQRPEVSGTDPNGNPDLPSAYVTLRHRDSGEPIGTYLVSTWFSAISDKPTQKVKVDSKDYQIALRFKRTYKPYTIHLHRFNHEVYPGTELDKDFSSIVHLHDPSTNEERDVRIWMNHPLRYHGETFYQSGVLPGDKGTVLQVVRNPSYVLPYVACALVSGGMLIHFLLVLSRFLEKQRAGTLPASSPVAEPEEPVLAAAGAPVGAPGKSDQITATRPAATGRFTRGARHRAALRARPAQAVETPAAPAETSPIVRFAPWIAVGLGVLYFACAAAPPADPPNGFHLQDFASLPVQDHGRVKPLDTFARTSLLIISDRQTFEDNKGQSQSAVRWLLEVMSGAGDEDKVFRLENDQLRDVLKLPERSGMRYSAVELGKAIDRIQREIARVESLEETKRDTFDGKVLDLKRKLQIYMEIRQHMTPALIPPPAGEQQWASLREVSGPARTSFKEALTAYGQNEPAKFNQALATFHQATDRASTADPGRIGWEVFLNDFEPFYQCSLLYVLIFLLGCISWIAWGEPLRRAAFWLAVVTLMVHTVALVSRMYLQNRWMVMVTNLYSSAIFISWVGVVSGLVLEVIYRNGIGVVKGAFLGAVSMLIAHLLATGDTMESLRAVLDTNFWLATHVTCITIGYSATFLAGGLGMAFIVCGALRLLGVQLDPKLFKNLSQMIYGVVCFATLFSFTGTVLGGIWADQSWGRFWGWDSKENGALLIVIWNALILHARWSGMVKAPGVAVLAVIGNIVTSWSWFGTNMLGVGLHSYGFMAGAVWGLVGTVLAFLAIAVTGMFLPKRAWG